MNIAFFLATLATILFSINPPVPASVEGAWHQKEGDYEAVLICKDGYLVITEFNQVNTAFVYTSGGPFKQRKGQLVVRIDFVSKASEKKYVGRERALTYTLTGDKMSVVMDDSTTKEMTRVDDGSGELAGAWRITGRMSNGQMNPIADGPRRTMKLLSGKRFQWIAFNTATGEFFGSGGGSYSLKDGKYTEHIEFFSRDPERVGTSVSFDAAVSNGVWTHKGLSSRGDPIHEEWSRQN